MSAELDLIRPLEGLIREGKLTATGLVLGDHDLSLESYEALGAFLGKIGDAARFALGDWLIYGSPRYGDRYEQAVEATGRSERTLLDYLRVSGRVAPARRRPELTWRHHRAVATLSPAEQSDWLERAIANRWSTAKLEHEIHGGSRRATTPTVLPAPPSVLTRAEAETAARVLDETGHRETKVAGKLRAAANGGGLVTEPLGSLELCERCGGSGYV